MRKINKGEATSAISRQGGVHIPVGLKQITAAIRQYALNNTSSTVHAHKLQVKLGMPASELKEPAAGWYRLINVAGTMYDPIVEAKLHAVLMMCGLDPIITLRGLGETGSVISGSVPVAVMKDLSFLPNDVDIYVPESQEATMHDVVLNRLDFSRSRDAIVKYPEYMGIRKIQWFTKGASKINLMIVAGENPLLSIIKFHSTIVMNIVTFRGMLILFPDMSADGLSLANSQQLLDYRHFERTMECINRYRERGIVFATNVGTHRLKV